MKIKLAYGKTGLDLHLDDNWKAEVVEPRFVPGVADPKAALRDALKAPIGAKRLASQIKSTDRVGIIFNDITRATPNQLILPAILAELRHVLPENILLFNALGTHRQNTEKELRQMLGDDLVNSCRIVQNNCLDKSTQTSLGRNSNGNEIWINRELMECDFRILTGFIEPHFFAGFSGGGKAVMPGMAGLETILRNHSVQNIGNARSIWGVTQGNPIWEEVRETAKGVAHFMVNVALNRDKAITAVFAGDLDEAYAQGSAFVKETAMVPLREPFDIVITSNSGYPLDLNLYQAVKGMSAAAEIVRQGGSIVTVAECWDGIPDHGLFGELLSQAESPHGILDQLHRSNFPRQDQWQVQVLAQILLKAEVFVHSGFLSEDQLHAALLKPASNLDDTITQLVQKYGRDTRICVLPEGPVTIPYLQK
jgi:nickel-dependent lactate racemase